MRIRDEHMHLQAKIYHSLGRLYVLDIDIARPVSLSAVIEEDAWRWHAWFGHMNFGTLRKMAREGLVRGLPLLSLVETVCEACLPRSTVECHSLAPHNVMPMTCFS
jgi:hypothetical protein